MLYQDRMVLCACSAYEQKYYFNPDFSALPQQVQDELKIMCVLFTEEVGGILSMVFDEDGELNFEVSAKENDFFFDEIGSGLKIKKLRQEKQELLESLETFYKVFFQGDTV